MPRSTKMIGLITSVLPPPASPEDAWQLLANAGVQAGVEIVFFHPNELDASTRRVRGRCYHPQRGWEKRTSPLPRVLIDNVHVHIARKHQRFSEQKKALQRADFAILNPRLPDKWGVWQVLSASPDLRSHLPPTVLLQDTAEVERWLAKQPAVFLKPVRGSGGTGVVEIRELGAESIRLSSASSIREIARQELNVFIEERLRASSHLLQKSIPLLDLDGQKLDLRVYLQRDGYGEWQAVTTVPRLASSGQVVTNLAQGGRVRTFDWLVHESRRKRFPVPRRSEVEFVAILAAEAITVKRPTLAFLGVDIALDPAGQIYLLDINPRPGRKSLTIEDKKVAFRLLVDYAASLLR